jgi:hypothetical protein
VYSGPQKFPSAAEPNLCDWIRNVECDIESVVVPTSRQSSEECDDKRLPLDAGFKALRHENSTDNVTSEVQSLRMLFWLDATLDHKIFELDVFAVQAAAR